MSATFQARIDQMGLSDVAQLAEVHVRSWRETYAGLMPQSFLDSLSVEKRAAMWTQILQAPAPDTLSLGVWRDDQLVGFLHAGPVRSPVDGSDFELYAIYLLKVVQGQGLGKKLMFDFCEFARSRGKTRASLLVLQGNPTERFYEKLGWRRGPEFDLTLNGETYKENSYLLDL